MTTMTTLTITNIINIQKYPIQDLTTPSAQTLISHCRNQMNEDGSLLLEQFIRPDYIKRMTEEVSNLTTHRRLEIVDVMKRDPWVDKKYYEDEDMLEQLPVNHPLKFQMSQDVYAVASDLVPKTSLIRLVYDSPMVMNFLAAVVNQPQIYQYGDEFQVRNIMLCFIDFKLLSLSYFSYLFFSFIFSFFFFSRVTFSLLSLFSRHSSLFSLSSLFFLSFLIIHTQALNIMYIQDGGSRAWHYDGSDYVVTLMLQVRDLVAFPLLFPLALCILPMNSWKFFFNTFFLFLFLTLLFFLFCFVLVFGFV